MNLIRKVEEILRSGAIEEYKQEAKLLVLFVSEMSLEEILVKEKIKNEDKILKIAQIRAEKKLPIQYLIGFCDFMGSKYVVNENVLIPRDETEILVRHCFELLKDKKEKLDILDIGIGSGCISCELAKLLKDKDVEILGVDISNSAIEVALENVNKQNLISFLTIGGKLFI